MGGGISYYFTSLEFPAHFWLGERCRFLHLCPSLWHQLWCQFGVVTDDISVDLHGGPLLVPMWSLWSLIYLLFLFLPYLRILVVSRGWIKRWNIALTSGRESRGPCYDVPSTSPLIFIVVYIGVWRVCWWHSHHIFMEFNLVAPGSGLGCCREIIDRLGSYSSGHGAVYWASAPPDLLDPLLSVFPH